MHKRRLSPSPGRAAHPAPVAPRQLIVSRLTGHLRSAAERQPVSNWKAPILMDSAKRREEIYKSAARYLSTFDQSHSASLTDSFRPGREHIFFSSARRAGTWTDACRISAIRASPSSKLAGGKTIGRHTISVENSSHRSSLLRHLEGTAIDPRGADHSAIRRARS